jgi:CHAT domain-containing protein
MRQLYQLCWKPLLSWLPKTSDRTIAIVPHKELALVPFAAMLDENGKRLIESHTITMTPSISLLFHLYSTKLLLSPKQINSNRLCLVVGNPEMPTLPHIGRLVSLPHAEIEARLVAEMLGTNALYGKSAHKAAVLNQIAQAKIIHIATHGTAESGRNSYIPGALVLARKPDENDHESDTVEDCLLVSEEIQQLNLSACELVVLTCCYSGHGAIQAEGLLGLGRAFLFAGVRAVVLSLWEVPDTKSTLTLIEQFYKSYLEHNQVGAALRKGMLHLQAHGHSERDWAPFYVLGAG